MLCDLQIFSGGVIPRARPHAQSLFPFPIVFGINNNVALVLVENTYVKKNVLVCFS